jgi:UDP-N-acetylmuramoyl-L-alanyl-D-glutamate--2,6-diaminopimelate ligase
MILQLPSFFPVTCHTDYVGSGSTFVAINGFKEDGTHYISQAIVQGATCIVVQKDVKLSTTNINLIKKTGVIVKYVEDARLALATLSAQAAHFPAKKLKIIGITGTKGKTTTTFLLAHILRFAGYKTALLSTVANIIDTHEFVSPLTTPQPDYLHQFFKQAVEVNTEYVVMEVAAQAVTMHRIADIQFDGIIFTNFSQEHLEFYKTLDDYFQAKCLLFKYAKSQAPLIVNADDNYCQKLQQQFEKITWLSMKKGGAIHGSFLADPFQQIDLQVNWQTINYIFFCPQLIGKFNGYNMLSAIGMALEIGISPTAISAALKTFAGVPGRMERYALSNGATAIIDYAHNPASYQEILSLLRQLTSQLIVIFGAGGNRDATKRPLMGKIAAKFADKVILTTDNPRTEDPYQIVRDIMEGISKTLQHKIICELDREKAIKKGYSYSRKNSIIVLLGKGNEEYQLIGNKKIYFSEKIILQELM